MRFLFTSNITRQKQSCKVIAAVKQRYKFLLLKYVLSFYKVDNDNQQLLKDEGSKFCRGSVGVRYDRPVTMLDAVIYTKEDWDQVTDETFKNADLRISLDSAVSKTFDNNKLLKLFKNFNITATEQGNNEFDQETAIDEQSSHLFREEILEKANLFLQTASSKSR